ncbi:hypothetical protein BpHYR1_047219 [Brachionus plicatilis]|uniref:Uncharacterized protein n=1 Tax=Brachionus plicatilis TaxID=10195 RepID=A0A3M7T5Q6_BRAPC|nr:hypothetical protein BpHYR1_047219 [Brachionus plicatilis]
MERGRRRRDLSPSVFRFSSSTSSSSSTSESEYSSFMASLSSMADCSSIVSLRWMISSSDVIITFSSSGCSCACSWVSSGSFRSMLVRLRVLLVCCWSSE